MLRPCVSVIATLLQSIVYYSKDDSTPEKASQNLPADTKKSDSMEEPAAAAAVAATEHSKDDSTPEKASQNLTVDTKKSDSMEEPAACQPSRRQTIKRCRLE